MIQDPFWAHCAFQLRARSQNLFQNSLNSLLNVLSILRTSSVPFETKWEPKSCSIFLNFSVVVLLFSFKVCLTIKNKICSETGIQFQNFCTHWDLQQKENDTQTKIEKKKIRAWMEGKIRAWMREKKTGDNQSPKGNIWSAISTVILSKVDFILRGQI